MSRERKDDFQFEKAVVLAFHEGLDASTPDTIEQALAPFVAPDWHWRGMHPSHEQSGAAAVARVFWPPLRLALRPLQRRPDIFIAGLNEIGGQKTTWVVEMAISWGFSNGHGLASGTPCGSPCFAIASSIGSKAAGSSRPRCFATSRILQRLCKACAQRSHKNWDRTSWAGAAAFGPKSDSLVLALELRIRTFGQVQPPHFNRDGRLGRPGRR